jgi:biopolymer transport protein ExbD
MGEIIQEEHGHKKGAKRRPKKHSTRIDMTPMVDLMCLLITFFMLTTAFSKPKVMEITMPEKNLNPEEGPRVNKERTLHIILTGDNKVYWYKGLADPNNKEEPMPVLAKTDFSKDGIRKILLDANKDLFLKIAEYREKRIKGEVNEADSIANRKIREFKKLDRKGPIVLIKADDKAKYRNIVDIVDEMAICNIASYAIVDISPVELDMLKTAPK